jgi:antitoxin CcdA
MAKKSVNLTFDEKLLAEAKSYNLNISKVAELGVGQAVCKAKESEWLTQNAKAIEASRAFLDKNGFWGEEFNPW